MAVKWKSAKVVNCKSMGVRSDPTDTPYDDFIIGEVKAGELIEVDPTDIVHDWKDRTFMKVKVTTGEGYAVVDCIELVKKGVTNGQHS